MLNERTHTFSPLLFLKKLMFRFFDDDVPGLSAQLAYYLLLSLFPFLIVAITLLITWIRPEQLIALLESYVPNQSLPLIKENLPDGTNSNKILSFGIIATIWAASSGIGAMIKALNHAYDVPENRHFLVARLIAILLTFAMLFMVLVAIVLPVFGHALGHLVFTTLGLSLAFETLWNSLRWTLSSIIIFIVILIIYYFAPNKRLYFREIWKGALFSTITWQLVSLAFSFYVNNFGNYTATYGSIGGIIILMLWFFISGMILIIGGEINATINALKNENK